MKNIYTFDVDGVITDLTTKVINPELVGRLEGLIKGGSIIIFNSGRAVSWVEENVIAKLNFPRDLMSDVFLVGEFGAVSVSYENGGERKETQDSEVSIREDLKEEVIRLLQKKYSESNFLDEAKKAMITLEKKDGYSLNDYLNLIPLIKADFEEILANKGLTSFFEVTSDPIAVNIRAEKLDKTYSTKVTLEWARKKNFEIGDFLVFGDQPSDLEMASEIAKQGYSVKMIYVGENPIDGGKDFPIVETQEKYTRGTLAFLEESQL
jgi:hydroxymethylpyrimidine pyrophosphatase-like HAD family hydrolase